MENVVTHEDWKVCFSELAPGLVLFARQFVRQLPDAEDIVQDAFVRFWRKEHSIENRGLLYATVRSVALDLLRRDARRALAAKRMQLSRWSKPLRRNLISTMALNASWLPQSIFCQSSNARCWS